jgi:hypothetical protein
MSTNGKMMMRRRRKEDDDITGNQNRNINFLSGEETKTQWLVTHEKYLNIGSTGGGFLLVTDCTTT